MFTAPSSLKHYHLHLNPLSIFLSCCFLDSREKMVRENSKQASLHVWTLVAGLLCQNLVIPVVSTTTVEDQKNYYFTPTPGTPCSPDPVTPSTPTGSHKSPPHGDPPPSHGGGGYGSTPAPSHGGGGYGSTPTPSHGGGSHGGTPPCHCGTGTPPSGGHHDPAPTPPAGGGGGGYYNPPSGGTTPSTPSVLTPPPTPGISTPTPPFDPNSPPFTGTCNFWSSHPGLIWGVLGYWGTLGGVFGVPSIPGFGSNMSLQEALSNTHADGFGALYREGTASLLNSMANRKFPFTTKEVRDSFVRATASNKAAAAQAHLFKLANEGRLKPRA